MRTEVPVLQRCCFCLPLRRGLLAWGYFKLIIASLLLFVSLSSLYQILNLYLRYRYKFFIKEIIIYSFMLFLSIVDIILHVTFIVGAHKKAVKFLRIYLYYGITLLVLTLILGAVSCGLMINNMANQYTTNLALLFTSNLTTIILNLIIQGYFLILVRSEMVKLDNVGAYRFVNNAANPECSMIPQQADVVKTLKEKFDGDQNFGRQNFV